MYKNSLISLRQNTDARTAKRRGLGAKYKQDNQRRLEDIQRRYMQIFSQPVKFERNDADFIGKEYLTEDEGFTYNDAAPRESLRPKARQDIVPEELKSDPEWMEGVQRLSEKYGFDPTELNRLVMKESGFNPRAVSSANAVGLFQFIPKVAEELGYTTDAIMEMSPAEQLDVYDKYLSRWNYDGSNTLAIVHAAPGFSNASDDTVVYEKGSAAWEQNPGWRSENDGDITVASINRFYR